MGKLLAVDLDGTLFYPKQIGRCIPKKNQKFLSKWIDAGNRVVLITSRSTQFLERLRDELDKPVDLLPCSSAQVVVNDKIVREEFIPNNALESILEKIENRYHPLSYMLTTKDHQLIIKQNRKINFLFKILYKLYWIFQGKYREK